MVATAVVATAVSSAVVATANCRSGRKLNRLSQLREAVDSIALPSDGTELGRKPPRLCPGMSLPNSVRRKVEGLLVFISLWGLRSCYPTRPHDPLYHQLTYDQRERVHFQGGGACTPGKYFNTSSGICLPCPDGETNSRLVYSCAR